MRPVHVLLAVLVAAIWGLNFVVIEVGLEDFPPLLLSALRYLLASLPLLVIGGRAGVRWKWILAVGGAIGVRTVVAAVLVVSGVLLTQRAPANLPQIAGFGARRPLRGEARAG